MDKRDATQVVRGTLQSYSIQLGFQAGKSANGVREFRKGSLECANCFLDLLDVTVYLDFRKDFRDASGSVDDDCRALYSHVFDAEQCMLFPDAKLVCEPVTLVHQQIVWKPILLPEALV